MLSGNPLSGASPRLVIDGRRLTADRTGVGRYLETLLEAWADTTMPCRDVVVVLSDRAGLKRIPKVSGLRGLVVAPRLPGLLWERFGLRPVLKDGDVLFAPSNLIPPNWNGVSILVLFDVMLEARPEDFPWHARLRFRSRYRSSARRASRILVPSEATAHDVSRYFGIDPHRMRVIHPSPDPRFQPLLAGAPEVVSARAAIPGLGDRPFFLFVGKRSRRRHVREILEAFASIRSEIPGHRLVFVGPVDEKSKDIGEGAIVAGHVADDVLAGLMASAEALLYPSEYEGFGLPVIEAMASGCPVITLRRPALVEAGRDGPIYLEEATRESIAGAMREVAMNRDLRADYVKRGLNASASVRPDEFGDLVREEIMRWM